MKVIYSLDVLKPHIPDSSFLALELKNLEGVSYVQIKVDEIDQKTTSVFIRIKGVDVKLEDITDKLESLKCALHSVDEVSIQDEES
ncbi:MAG: DUF211 domain-containing protein [Promethearchaeota archaeon]